MFPSVRIFTLAVLICLCRPAQSEIRTAADLMTVLQTNRVNNLPFALTGRVTSKIDCRNYTVYALEDETDSAVIIHYPRPNDIPFALGDTLDIHGVICVSELRLRRHDTLYNDARDRSIRILKHVPASAPPAFDAVSFRSGKLDNRPCRLTGIVRDFRRDELDPEWNYMVLESDGMTLNLYNAAGEERPEALTALVGSTILADGLCVKTARSFRRQLGRVFHLPMLPKLKVISPAPSDPFDVPALPSPEILQPYDFQSLGQRRIAGAVRAVWNGDTVLLQISEFGFARVELLTAAVPPPFGSVIEVVGYPETDLCQVILTRSRWRLAPSGADIPDFRQQQADGNIPFVGSGTCANVDLHGCAVGFEGSVFALPTFRPNFLQNVLADFQFSVSFM